MAVAAEPEHREVHRSGVQQALMARALGTGVGGGAVQRVHCAEVDPGELAPQVGGVAAGVARAQPEARETELRTRREIPQGAGAL